MLTVGLCTKLQPQLSPPVLVEISTLRLTPLNSVHLAIKGTSKFNIQWLIWKAKLS